jgi:hypothetical protein
MWRLEEELQGTEVIQEMLRIRRLTPKGVAELGLGRGSRSGKALCLAVKRCLTTLPMDKEELIRGYL